MKPYNKYSFRVMTAFLFCAITIVYSCKKSDGSGFTLGALPKADFNVVPSTTNANNLTLVNNSSTASIPYWTTSTGVKVQGDSAKINFVFAGTYTVTLMVAAHGGIDSVTKTITIAQNDPTACVNTTLGFIAGCSSRTWKLNPTAGAMQVGPNGPGDGQWWQNGTSDVAGRAGDFNDTYTFSFNAAGTYAFDDAGDFYSDNYMGTMQYTTQANSFLSAAQKPWSAGKFTYVFIAGGGANKLGQIKLVGLGAHMGMPKVTNAAEVTTPSTSITYDIGAMSTDSNGKGHLQVAVNTGGYEWWTFNLISVN